MHFWFVLQFTAQFVFSTLTNFHLRPWGRASILLPTACNFGKASTSLQLHRYAASSTWCALHFGQSEKLLFPAENNAWIHWFYFVICYWSLFPFPSVKWNSEAYACHVYFPSIIWTAVLLTLYIYIGTFGCKISRSIRLTPREIRGGSGSFPQKYPGWTKDSWSCCKILQWAWTAYVHW